jgi:hypothetical protein
MDTNPTRLQQPSPSLALSTAKSVPSGRKGTRVNRPVQHRGRAIRPGKPGTPSSISAEEEEEQQQQIIPTRRKKGLSPDHLADFGVATSDRLLPSPPRPARRSCKT